MIDDAHLIGLGVVHPDWIPDLRDRLPLRSRARQCIASRGCTASGRPIFGAVLGHTLVVVSDAHLGVTPPAVEAALLAFLEAVPTLGDCLLINGDLFDFWFSYSRVIPRRGFHVAAALARPARRMPVLMVGGNHDRWGGDFWERDLGSRFHPHRLTFELGETDRRRDSRRRADRAALARHACSTGSSTIRSPPPSTGASTPSSASAWWTA